MNSTKIVIICLIFLMLLFFIGLSLNLIEKPEKGANPNKQEQRSATLEYSWPKAVDNILAPFADSITAKELSFSNCSRTGNGFILNEQNKKCTIKVTGFSETFKKLSLKPSSRTVKLKIRYKPKGKKEDEFFWPSKDQKEDNINFVIMGKEELQGQTAATITIECINCTNQKNVKITFE